MSNLIPPFTTGLQSSSNQFLRKWGLIVGGQGGGGQGLDLSNLEFEFKTTQGSFDAPSIAQIRIFNPNPNTVNSIQKEFTAVALQAGYQNGNFGVIFNGIIMQVRTGKLENVTRFIDIMAADGWLFHTYGFVNTSINQNASNQDQLNVLENAAKKAGVTLDPSSHEVINNPTAVTGGILPRGKALGGVVTDYADDLADKTDSEWFIEDGKLKFVKRNSYLPGEAIVINSQTGQIGVPEVTEQGIYVQCLLNPKIKVHSKIQLNNNEITQVSSNTMKDFPNITVGAPTTKSITQFALLNPSGIYKCIVKEHIGQTRGNAWYTNLVCLTGDATTNQVSSN